MKNKEKYAKEIIEEAIKNELIGFDKQDNQVKSCFKLSCENCLFYRTNNEIIPCRGALSKWANAECEVSKCGEVSRFTEREKKYIWLNWDCNYVQRTLHGQVWFYSKRPRSNESISGLLFAYPQKILDFLNIPFEGIKEGETVSREEILGESNENKARTD